MAGGVQKFISTAGSAASWAGCARRNALCHGFVVQAHGAGRRRALSMRNCIKSIVLRITTAVAWRGPSTRGGACFCKCASVWGEH